MTVNVKGLKCLTKFMLSHEKNWRNLNLRELEKLEGVEGCVDD